jgi:hypothetical protein
VVFDTTHGPIVHADFRFTAILNFAVCVEMPAGGQGFVYNDFRCGHLHTNADGSTLLQMGLTANQNTVAVRVGVDQGAEGVTGLALGGAYNCLEVNTRGGFPVRQTLVLDKPARGNQINFLCGDVPVTDLVTDNAKEPTNQVTWTGSPPPVESVKVPSETFVYVQRLFPAAVRITGGTVGNVAMVRGDTAVDCEVSQPIVLSVGDRLRIGGTEPVELIVVPLKAR